MEITLQTPLLATAIGLTLITLLYCTESEETDADNPKISNYNLNFTMNWLTRKMPVVVAALGIVLIAVISCNKQDNEVITEDLKVETTNALYSDVLTLLLYNAADETTFPPDDAKITVFGKDKHRILSITGEKTLTIRDGVIEAGVASQYAPSASKPLEFGILIQAPGYLDVYRNFRATSTTNPLYEAIGMYQISNLPQAVQYGTNQVGLNSRGEVNQDVTLSSTGVGAASFLVKSGTKLYDANGKQLKGGVLKMSVFRFDATQEIAMDGLSGGMPYVNATDKKGNDLGNGSFTPFNFFDVSMTVNGVAVKKLSEPMEASVLVPTTIKRTVNSLNGSANPVKTGDKLGVWSLNRETQQWVFEQLSTVTGSGRGSRAVYKQHHLSLWAIADPSSRALYEWLEDGSHGDAPSKVSCSKAGVRIQSNLPALTEETADEDLYVKVRNANNPWMTIGSFYSSLANGTSIDLSYMLGGSNQSVVWDIYDGDGGDNLHHTGTILPCSNPYLNLTNRITRAPLARRVKFRMNVAFACAGRGNGLAIRPNANVFIQEAGKRPRKLGRLRNGISSSFRVKEETAYNFSIRSGHLSASSAQLGFPAIKFPVDRSPCTLRFRNPVWGLDQSVTAAYNNAQNAYIMNANFAAPAALCDKWFNR
ncbi:MAG: hypothetical protein RLZZ628_2356 [Bacteroidota bacterium]|jgi:hypothetical protein